MLKRIFILLLFLNFTNWAQAQSINASVSYKQFKYGEQVLVETYIKIPSSSIQYKAVDGGYQAEINASYYFEDSQSNTIFCGNKLKIVSPLEAGMDVSKDILFRDQCLINAGQYNLYIELQDAVSQGDKISSAIPVSINKFTQEDYFSDIIFVHQPKKATKEHMFYKAGYNMTPFIPNGDYFFDDHVKEFTSYFEIYNIPSEGKHYIDIQLLNLEDRSPVEGYNFKKVLKSGEDNSIAQRFEIDELESGNYLYSVVIKDKEHNTLAGKEEFFQNFNSSNQPSFDIADYNIEKYLTVKYNLDSVDIINQYLYAMGYSKESKEALQYTNGVLNDNLQEKKNLFFSHWTELNAKNPEKPFMDFKLLFDYANSKFGNQVLAGYKADRGRVMIQYGMPDDVEENSWDTETHPYEIWQFYQYKSQRNIIFVFYDPGAAGSYSLVHSNARDEKTLPEWQRLLSRNRDGSINEENFGTRFQNNRIINQGSHHPLEE